ncbi:MAG: DUF805 domain-containing protein [Proteobacteria bacterium]|nr:DUF805 domain-containing protein [Pseudomonadota bacterium]
MSLLGRHFTGLADFSGRENRQPFWLWILIVYAAQMVGSMVIAIPLMTSMFDRMAPMANQDPDYFNKHPEAMQQMMNQVMAPMMQNWMLVGAVGAVLMIVLIAAAVVRRLHDSDRSGWWAAPYFALGLAGPILSAVMMPNFFKNFATIRPEMTPDQAREAMRPVMQSFAGVWGIGMLGFIVMILMIVLLCQPGTPGPNRYGDDPLTVR